MSKIFKTTEEEKIFTQYIDQMILNIILEEKAGKFYRNLQNSSENLKTEEIHEICCADIHTIIRKLKKEK